MAAGLAGLAGSRWLPLSLGCLLLVGGGGVVLMASSNTLVQTFVEDDKRGRVMSLFTMGFTGTMPLGNLAVGAVAGVWGPRLALLLSGLACALVMVYFRRQVPGIRRFTPRPLRRPGND